MKNIPSLRFARHLSIRNAFILSTFVAFNCFVIVTLNSCSSGPSSPAAGVGTQTTTIYGRIIDETGASLTGVTVSAGVKTAITDANGIFIIKDATVPQGRAVVIAKKPGFFNAARAEVPNTNGTTRMALSMMSDAATANVSAISGGTINVTGGASIAFSGGCFTDASGTAYTGQVKVSAHFLDPRNVNFFDFFSGDDVAQTSSGKSASLISAGVLRVELKDQSGNTLKLDASKPATISYPKPIDTKAPTAMPLWYFDEELGMWKEEGSATLKNGIYSGTVTHFTDHNLDYYDSSGNFSNSTVSLRVVCNGIPIGGVAVSIVGDDAPGKYFVHPGGMTGPDGRITFIRFPYNRPTQIDISSVKNNGLYYLNTPKSVTVTNGQTLDLGDVNLDSPCPASMTGSLECNGTKVEGLVTVSDGKNISYAYTKTGDFGIQVPSTLQLTVDATNANGDVANSTIVPALASGEQRNIGSIGLCGSGVPNYTEINVGNTSAIAFSADDTRLAIGGGSILTVYDAITGNILSSVTNTPAFNTLQFSLDGSKLLAAENYFNSAGITNVYDVSGTTATIITSISNIINAKLYDDGTKFMASPGASSGNIVIYSAADGSVIKTLTPTLTGKNNYYSNFGFIRDENAAVYQDGQTARVWSAATDAELRNFPVTGESYYFASSEDGHTVATGGGGLSLSCFDTKTGAKIGDLPGVTNSSRDSVGSLLLTQNFVYTSSSINGAVAVKIFKISDGTARVRLLSGSDNMGGMAASRNEKYLAASQNGKVRIWKLQ